MHTVTEQKLRLEQKKNRLIAEETKLKLKERKARTRHLIELGGLIVKADLDNLPTNTLYGSLLSLKDSLTSQSDIQDQWTKTGKAAFDQEQQQKTAVILKLEEKPSLEIRAHIRSHTLKWNHLRKEWYGYVLDLQDLKDGLGDLKYELQLIQDTI
ncbi:conjugal transfer protein TraD [Candidatus Tisiphia endosymbiont of Ceraclea dissimilis]|uniref:conjugal transfer protein TraD n=1 Tax=Candidatus Tisiphia endosymbiont of Ceraclea dissimilis TaxID=3077928 RepID=UPI003CCAABB1